jgi:hypothetical protein
MLILYTPRFNKLLLNTLKSMPSLWQFNSIIYPPIKLLDTNGDVNNIDAEIRVDLY